MMKFDFKALVTVFMFYFPIILPFATLFSGVFCTIKRRKANKPIALSIIMTVLITAITSIPLAFLFIDSFIYLGICFIGERFLLAVFSWVFFFIVAFIIAKSIKRNPSKPKIIVSILLCLSLLAFVCWGTFSGFFLETMKTLLA